MSAPTSSHKLTTPLQSPRYWIIVLAVVQALVCLFILQSRVWDSASHPHSCAAQAMVEVLAQESTTSEPSASPTPKETLSLAVPVLVNGAPTASFRDNLRTDVKYITSWPANGWSNQVIQYMNLLYLARLTERVPIIPRFRPVHLDGNVSHIDFGDIFDLPRLRKELKTPILEWREVKDLRSEMVEDLGCWDIQYKTWEAESLYLEPPVDLNLDISYTPVPQWVHNSLEADKNDRSMYLWPLASLITFNKRATSLRALPPPALSPLHQKAVVPDDQLFCCNSLQFGIELLEKRQDIAPAWQTVGRHMHWAPAIQEIAANRTRQTLGIEAGERIPPYIAVHVRRGDFSIWCGIDGIPVNECFAPLSAYVRRVKEVRAAILENTGVAVDRVIITSDETDPAWWASVLKLGWLRPNHTETVERYGAWYPTFIDAVIHGAAYGFVGTDRSTVSILARRRVFSKGGVTEMVKWGRPRADDH
ncbi:putative O-fucosyltransferase-like protein [Mycena venus]|uniref:GDP-fucose protein O-fucosyltransferase 2 n=1 Tax=Mycena venus TaxID=2733690 RepID=A0A8H6YJV2_9AGAR|nr:putative O-fucosyltransferase-like protein [Mycena venus]